MEACPEPARRGALHRLLADANRFEIRYTKDESERVWLEWFADKLGDVQWAQGLLVPSAEVLAAWPGQVLLPPRASTRSIVRKARCWVRELRHDLGALAPEEFTEAEFCRNVATVHTAFYPRVAAPFWNQLEVAYGLAVELPCVVRAFGLTMASNLFNGPGTPRAYGIRTAFHTLWIRNVALALLSEAGAHGANRNELQYYGKLWWISSHLRQNMRQAGLEALVG